MLFLRSVLRFSFNAAISASSASASTYQMTYSATIFTTSPPLLERRPSPSIFADFKYTRSKRLPGRVHDDGAVGFHPTQLSARHADDEESPVRQPAESGWVVVVDSRDLLGRAAGEVIGTLLVLEVADRYSVASILEGKDFERGQKLELISGK